MDSMLSGSESKRGLPAHKQVCSDTKYKCHATMHGMADAVQRVIDDGVQLQKLRERLADLEAERARVEGEIAACMQRIAATAGGVVPPPANMKISQQILWLLKSHRDRAFAPADVAAQLGLTATNELENIRVHLSRMRDNGTIKRIAHGRYQAFPE